MKLLFAIGLVVMAAFGGCQKEPADLSDRGPRIETYGEEEQACVKRGGRWGKGGLADFYVCYEPTRDANKSCSSGADCEGLCLARSRTCTPIKPIFGCNEVLTETGSRGTLCID